MPMYGTLLRRGSLYAAVGLRHVCGHGHPECRSESRVRLHPQRVHHLLPLGSDPVTHCLHAFRTLLTGRKHAVQICTPHIHKWCIHRTARPLRIVHHFYILYSTDSANYSLKGTAAAKNLGADLGVTAEQALVLAVPLIERGATALVEAFAPQLPARVVPQLSALHDPRKPAFDSEGAICEDKKGAAYLYSQYHSLLRLSRLGLNHILHSELTTLFQLSSTP